MKRNTSITVITTVVILCFLALPVQAEAACTRAGLKTAVDSYISAQKAGNPSALRLAEGAKYSENLKSFMVEGGILTSALPIAFHRDFYKEWQKHTKNPSAMYLEKVIVHKKP